MPHSVRKQDKQEAHCSKPYVLHFRDEELHVDPYDAPFWDKVVQGRWEPHTFDILSRMLSRDSVYCDLGAWIGPTVLYAAKQCKDVVCVEPDPVAYQRLSTNLHLNNVDNVTSFQFALSNRNGQQRIASFRRKLGDSMASLLARDESLKGAEVETMTWDSFGHECDVDRFDFIKIDIEGAEFDLMSTMERYLAGRKPVVYLSLHPHLLPLEARERAVRDVFSSMRMYRHCMTPDLRPVDTKNLHFDTENAYRGTFLFTDD